MVRRSRFAGLTEYEMDRNYVLIANEDKYQSSLSFFDVLQDRKRQNRKRNTTGSVRQKNEQSYTTVPCPHYVVTKLSHVCLAHPRRCCKNKITTNNQDKHDRKCIARKTNNHVPLALTTSRQTPLCLPSAPASMLQEKKTKKKKQTGSSLHEKQNNHVPPALTTSRQTLSCLPGPLSGMRCDHRHLCSR